MICECGAQLVQPSPSDAGPRADIGG
jgi:hypothetical protein